MPNAVVSPSLGDATFACLVWGKTNTIALGTSPCPAGDILALAEGVLVRGRATCFTENRTGGGRSGTVTHPPPISTAEACLCGIHPHQCGGLEKEILQKSCQKRPSFCWGGGSCSYFFRCLTTHLLRWTAQGKGRNSSMKRIPSPGSPPAAPGASPWQFLSSPMGQGLGFPLASQPPALVP